MLIEMYDCAKGKTRSKRLSNKQIAKINALNILYKEQKIKDD